MVIRKGLKSNKENTQKIKAIKKATFSLLKNFDILKKLATERKLRKLNCHEF